MTVQAREQGSFNRACKHLIRRFKAGGVPQRAGSAEGGQGRLRGGGAIAAKASWMSRSLPGESEGRRNVSGRGTEVMLKEQKGIKNDWSISCKGGAR